MQNKTKALRKILNNIKQLFHKAEQQVQEQTEKTETPKPKPEKSLKLKDLIPELNEIDEESLFASIVPGDIIYAVTHPSANELVKIEPQHRIRPYIVASRTENKLVVYSGSSNVKRKYKHSFTLSKERYDIFKSGKINIGRAKILTVGMVVGFVGALKADDIIKINMDILFNKDGKYHPPIEKEYKIREGLVFKKGDDLYCAGEVRNENVLLYPMNSEEGEVPIRFNKARYYINPEKSFIESDLDSYYAIGHWMERNKIKNKIEKQKIRKSIKHVPVTSYAQICEYNYPIGQIFYNNDSYQVYLFSVNGNDFGFDEDDLYDNNMQIRKLTDLDMSKKEEIMEDETLRFAVDEIARKLYNYSWLKDIVTKEMAQA